MCVCESQKFQNETFFRERIANMSLHLKLVLGASSPGKYVIKFTGCIDHKLREYFK